MEAAGSSDTVVLSGKLHAVTSDIIMLSIIIRVMYAADVRITFLLRETFSVVKCAHLLVQEGHARLLDNPHCVTLGRSDAHFCIRAIMT